MSMHSKHDNLAPARGIVRGLMAGITVWLCIGAAAYVCVLAWRALS